MSAVADAVDIKARREQEYRQGFREVRCPRCQQMDKPFARVEPPVGGYYKVKNGLVQVLIECPDCNKQLVWGIIKEVWWELHEQKGESF